MRYPLMSKLYLLCLMTLCRSFYVPGMAPRSFKLNEIVEIKAVKLTSVVAQLPYDYYSLGFCQPKEGMVYKSENLGEVLRGDRIVNTPYKVQMLKPISCLDVCNKVTLNKEASMLMAKRIQQHYNVHLLTDNLPCATKIQDSKTHEVIYRRGYWLGFVEKGVAYINNHLKFTILYHTIKDENNSVYEIVGFQVVARSVKHIDGQCNINENSHWQPISEKGPTDVRFTYEVEWIHKNIEWSSRWNNYLDMKDTQIHWFSIVNSLVVVCFLASILALIIVRTLKRDITRYNTLDDEEDTFEETGWKLVHGDVFRPPRFPRALAVLIGSGVQLFSSSFFVIIFAVLGMLSPANRGSLMTVALFTFVFVGMLAGFHSGRIYKTIMGTQWKRSALAMAMFYPSVIFGVCFILNFFIWGKHSSGAVPFKTMIALLFMWMGISVPLILIGFYYGYRKKPYSHPNRTNRIPRQVPEQSWYYNPFIGMLLAGILPFGAMFIELFFIFTAIWENQFYYLFGFLFLVFLILIVSCSQISIVMVYFQLCSEDYHWWWRSFIVSGGSAIYVFVYSIFYFVAKLDITEFTPTLLYFGYTLLMVFTFWLVNGTIGFYAAYFFIRKIYGAIKIE